MALGPLRSRPLVSVLVANYNYAEYVGQAIESIRKQSYPEWELVICDDGSTDGSAELLAGEAANDSRIRLLLKENGGQASAVNRAFAEARGEVICILDADDTFGPSKLARVVSAFAARPTAGMAIHDLQVVDGGGRPRWVSRFRREGHLGPEIPTLRMDLPIPQASGLSFRRPVLAEILPLPEEEFRSVADWAIGYAAAYITNTTLIPEVLAEYRVHDRNLSGTTSAAARLEVAKVEGILRGMQRVLGFTDRFLRERGCEGIPLARVRNVLEHRLMLGILRRDSAATREAVAELRDAYRTVRRDYPRGRYVFWRAIAALPTSAAPAVLSTAFQLFRVRARVKAATVP